MYIKIPTAIPKNDIKRNIKTIPTAIPKNAIKRNIKTEYIQRNYALRH